MSSQQYERVPLVENGVPLDQLDPSYYTGIPNTAPPSFRSVASSNHHHRNLPSPQYPPPDAAQESDEASISEDPGISLWGGSSTDAESVRENTIMLLMHRVEMLEHRLEEQPLANKGLDIAALAERKRRDFWMTVGLTFIMAVIFLGVWANIQYARHAGQLRDNNPS